jgi:hypothetical protein
LYLVPKPFEFAKEYVCDIRYTCYRSILIVTGIPGKVVSIAIRDDGREHVIITKPVDLARWAAIKTGNGSLPSIRRSSS